MSDRAGIPSPAVTAAPRTVTTTYTTLTWSPDHRSVTKVRNQAHDARRRFRYELKVNALLRDRPPPVPTPRLLGHDIGARSFTMEAVAGEPLGPKYPTELAPDDLDEVLALLDRLRAYDLRRRWLRRLNSVGRLAQAHPHDLLTTGQTEALQDLAEARAARLEPFLLSALLVTLWHLQWYLPGPFREKHLATKDELVERLIG